MASRWPLLHPLLIGHRNYIRKVTTRIGLYRREMWLLSAALLGVMENVQNMGFRPLDLQRGVDGGRVIIWCIRQLNGAPCIFCRAIMIELELCFSRLDVVVGRWLQ